MGSSGGGGGRSGRGGAGGGGGGIDMTTSPDSMTIPEKITEIGKLDFAINQKMKEMDTLIARPDRVKNREERATLKARRDDLAGSWTIKHQDGRRIAYNDKGPLKKEGYDLGPA